MFVTPPILQQLYGVFEDISAESRMFNLVISTTPTVLEDTGMSQNMLNKVISTIEMAAKEWGRYVHAPNAQINLDLKFEDLQGNILANAGAIFFSSGGPFKSEVIEELNGRNTPFDSDAIMTIDLPKLLNNNFYFPEEYGFELSPGGAGQIDFLTLVLHELAHSLGFLGMAFEGLVENGQFVGANAVESNGGDPVDLADGVHTSEEGDLLFPSIDPNYRAFITPVHIAILKDLGLPIAQATEFANELYGFHLHDDIIRGLGGDDTLHGLTGDDRLSGDEGNDYLYGDEGNDYLYGDEGNDYLYGDEGNDYLDGGSGNDSFYGGTGLDTLIGADGHDHLVGGQGADVLDGGAGIDAIRYDLSNAGVSISLASGHASGGDAEGDVFSNIEAIIGSAHADELIGDDAYNILFGEAGADVIYGGGGNDYLYGGLDNDILLGGQGSDELVGGAGHDAFYGQRGFDLIRGGDGNDHLLGGEDGDYLDGGAGIDAIRYDLSDEGISVSLESGAATGGTAQGDVFVNIEAVVGSSHADQIIGDANYNILFGASGNDILFGGGGDDYIDGGQNHDILLGGSGNDELVGGAGDDAFYGESGNDIIRGGSGNDHLLGGQGGDFLDGGTGIDAIRYDLSQSGVYVSLKDGTASGGAASGDSFSNIEAIVGSAHGDQLFGDDFSNILFGGIGDDILNGHGGSDYLDGGSGYDIAIFDGIESDYFITQLSNNTFNVLDLLSGSVDTIVEIEEIYFDDYSIMLV